MPLDAARAKSLFLAVSEIADPADRAAYLGNECNGDAELRARVEALLKANDAAPLLPLPQGNGAQATGDPGATRFYLDPKSQVGQVIAGRYKLLQQIGEGGMGTVWMADQTQPVKRRVAVKLISIDRGNTKMILSRFEAERQAIALMDHPHIARLLDAGTTDAGHPFFVMELVKGIPLTEYCDTHKLGIPERLVLFQQVCSAVQHAHQKGIIHRDIKPSNILVESHDGQPVPKVIDFGLAKATTGMQLTEHTLFTAFGNVMGTPCYMAPEQATFNAVDVDTRADVYSLGVILYELLTGTTPITRETVKKVAFDEVLKLVREQDAPRPSTRLSTTESKPQTAVNRNVDQMKLSKLVKGDLDCVVLKALAKDRTRRYETANALAMDIKRHLNNEPVLARPPSKFYEFQKSVRRHKVGFAATAAVIVVLATGIAMTIWQAVRATRESSRATAALEELRKTAPTFAEQARSLAAKGEFDDAVEKLDYALKLRPDSAEFLVAKGDLLQCQVKLAQAATAYREALQIEPGLARAEASAKLCDELLAAKPADDGKLSSESLAALYLSMQRQQRPAAELMPVRKLLVEYWLERLKDLPVPDLKQRLTVRDDGLFAIYLGDTAITKLSPFIGMPLGGLYLDGCGQISDFKPLREFRSLTSLSLRGTRITDLGPLRGLPLQDLYLDRTEIHDISALRGMKLKSLSLRQTRVADLSALAGMPLAFFDATAIPAANFSPLAGAPLETCVIQSTPVRDLSFFRDCPIKQLILYNCNEARGFAVLGTLKSLNRLVLPERFRTLPEKDVTAIGALRSSTTIKNIQGISQEAFWKEWDAYELFSPLRKNKISFTIKLLNDNTYRLEIRKQELPGGLSILKGMPVSDLALYDFAQLDLSQMPDLPLKALNLYGSTVADLRPLSRFALRFLDLRTTPVSDLTPLQSAPLRDSLKELLLWKSDVTDFSPVAACTNLEVFDASDTALDSLDCVRGRKLSVLRIGRTQVADISAIAGMPLEEVALMGTPVTDLSPLLQCRTLKSLVLPQNAANVSALRKLPALVSLSYEGVPGGQPKQSAAEFWKEFDAKQKAEAKRP